MKLIKLVILALLVLGGAPRGYGADASLLKATVRDLDGKPVAGAKLFLYDSANTRRAAEFISVKSGTDGTISITVPPGRYWVVAREKKDDTYGPLARGDRHSGEPAELEFTAGQEQEFEFTVTDIQEAKERQRLKSADFIRIKGRILDGKGGPVANAYVFARHVQDAASLPDFLSAWTDSDGSYQLYLPAGGTYFLAAASQFPPGDQKAEYRPIRAEGGKQDIALDLQLQLQ